MGRDWGGVRARQGEREGGGREEGRGEEGRERERERERERDRQTDRQTDGQTDKQINKQKTEGDRDEHTDIQTRHTEKEGEDQREGKKTDRQTDKQSTHVSQVPTHRHWINVRLHTVQTVNTKSAGWLPARQSTVQSIRFTHQHTHVSLVVFPFLQKNNLRFGSSTSNI